MSFETIETERDGRVQIIRFNRPEKMNAYIAQMGAEVAQVLREGNADAAVGAFVVTGNGRAFCAGADISSFAASQASGGSGGGGEPEEGANNEPFDPIYLASSKPIIGAINGAAVGMGLTWPLLFDVLVASTKARFSMRFAALGLTPELGSTWLLPKIIGVQRAREMMLTGKIYSAEEAHEFGLVHRVVPHEDLLPEAVTLAAEIAENPTSTLRTVKEMIWNDLVGTDFQKMWKTSTKNFSASLQSDEAKEAVNAFVEKRSPQFHD